MKKGWDEITRGAEIKVPTIFKFVIKWVTPFYLLVIFGYWLWIDAIPILLMHNVPEHQLGIRWLSRGVMLVLLVLICYMVWRAWKRRPDRPTAVEEEV